MIKACLMQTMHILMYIILRLFILSLREILEEGRHISDNFSNLGGRNHVFGRGSIKYH